MEGFIVLSWLVCGFLCFFIADARGRNPILGFFAGTIFGIFAILYYVIAGDTSKKRAEAFRDAMDNRDR